MAKKSKPRKAAPKKGENLVLGSVMIPVKCTLNIGPAANISEFVIEWACLGLSEEPDSIAEVSGNSRLVDGRQEPYTDEDGLHVFFDPPLAGNASGITSIGLEFHCSYNEAVEARSTPRKTDLEIAKEKEKREEAAAKE